jgi:hypothetical protein
MLIISFNENERARSLISQNIMMYDYDTTFTLFADMLLLGLGLQASLLVRNTVTSV